MAIMQRCCCFSNVRSGSMACGVYSLITSWIYLAVDSWNLAQYVNAFTRGSIPAPEPTRDGIYAAYGIGIIVAAFLLIASIILMVGVPLHNRMMLVPYMVAITTVMVLQAIAWTIIFVLLGLYGLVSGLLIGSFVVWLLFTALNITCLICVISQYQELSEGRGRANNFA